MFITTSIPSPVMLFVLISFALTLHTGTWHPAPRFRVSTSYLLNAKTNALVQDTQNNRATYPAATRLHNFDFSVQQQQAFNCRPYLLPSLTDPAAAGVTSLAANALYALRVQPLGLGHAYVPRGQVPLLATSTPPLSARRRI